LAAVQLQEKLWATKGGEEARCSYPAKHKETCVQKSRGSGPGQESTKNESSQPVCAITDIYWASLPHQLSLQTAHDLHLSRAQNSLAREKAHQIRSPAQTASLKHYLSKQNDNPNNRQRNASLKVQGGGEAWWHDEMQPPPNPMSNNASHHIPRPAVTTRQGGALAWERFCLSDIRDTRHQTHHSTQVTNNMYFNHEHTQSSDQAHSKHSQKPLERHRKKRTDSCTISQGQTATLQTDNLSSQVATFKIGQEA